MTINAPGRTRLSPRERWALVARLIAGVPVTWTDEYEDQLDADKTARYYAFMDDNIDLTPRNTNGMGEA